MRGHRALLSISLRDTICVLGSINRPLLVFVFLWYFMALVLN